MVPTTGGSQESGQELRAHGDIISQIVNFGIRPGFPNRPKEILTQGLCCLIDIIVRHDFQFRVLVFQGSQFPTVLQSNCVRSADHNQALGVDGDSSEPFLCLNRVKVVLQVPLPVEDLPACVVELGRRLPIADEQTMGGPLELNEEVVAGGFMEYKVSLPGPKLKLGPEADICGTDKDRIVTEVLLENLFALGPRIQKCLELFEEGREPRSRDSIGIKRVKSGLV